MFNVWEYNVISLDEFSPPDGRGFDLRLQRTMAHFGRDGWELAGMVNGDGDDVFLGFKRPTGGQTA
jgi:hypothetical protein